MTRLQLMALVKNISLNIKNSMRCAKNCFYDFGESNWGRPTPEICFFTWQLRWTILPKERYGDSLSVGRWVNRTPNLPIRAVWKVVAPPKKTDGALEYQQAFRQMHAFLSQLQISPLSSAMSKPKQAKLIMYNLRENNFDELPMQK